MAASVEEMLEVVYIPAKGDDEKGQGTSQCRTKVRVAQGVLRLYPYGGTLKDYSDESDRRSVEKGTNIKSCYMKALEVSGKIHSKQHVEIVHFVL